MESINLELKTSKKRLCINGDENKILEFNPENIETRKKFYNASKKIFEKQRELDVILEKLGEEAKVEEMFEIEEQTFNFMKEIIDEIFGEGVTDMITDGEKNIFAITNFAVAIAPYFKDVAEKQKNKYTNTLKDVGII